MSNVMRIRRSYSSLYGKIRGLQHPTRMLSSPIIIQSGGRQHSRLSTVAFQDQGTRQHTLLAPILLSMVGLGAAVELAHCEMQQRTEESVEEVHEVINWSGTHSVETPRYYQPETVQELKEIVKKAHENHEKLRPVGSGLSPNGLGLEKGGMVNLIMMDNVLGIDVEKKQVRVQAGVRVSQLVDALRPHGLTLQNFASITEQQVGGFTQVGAHGTGTRLPPVDEQVVGIKMITPAVGEIDLSVEDDDPSLFQLARTSMGLLGIVVELTLQCVPAHRLVEKTFVMSREEVWQKHEELMRENRHLRYLWVPYRDCVIVITCNPLRGDMIGGEEVVIEDFEYGVDERLASMRSLLKSHPACRLSDKQIMELRFTSLRDELLAIDPLDVEWVKKVNTAEEDSWRKSQGTRVDWSDRILQFDCGGQQWVSEVAFPIPKKSKTLPDLQYMQNLMNLIEEESIPAHSPIEQRWSAPSLSPMSPVGEKPDKDLAAAYSWVGIIMYLPDATTDKGVRQKITSAFKVYTNLCDERLWFDARAIEHWAKIEMPDSPEAKARLQLRTYQKYPVDAFKAICNLFDPHQILGNDLMDTILGVDSKTTTLESSSHTA